MIKGYWSLWGVIAEGQVWYLRAGDLLSSWVDTLYTFFGIVSTHYKTESAHFLGACELSN